MIERKFISRNLKTYLIDEYLGKNLKRVGFSCAKVQRTPLGEKVIIYASRPGLIVGKKGSNIKKLTIALKNKFGLENPQIEISEVVNVNLDAQIVAERIASSLERFGAGRFKSIGHRVIEDVMNAGALGIEIIISGKIPGARAKSWRFYQGYLKKCGDIALTGVNVAKKVAKLKTGVVGIKVSIMPPGTILPDHMELREEKEEVIEEVKENPEGEEEKEATKEEVKEENKSEVKETPAPEKEDKKNKE
ncbi:MAG: 30S ribosomal protein S3 [Nanoarchaeota archaeon]|nr:30S ribosomal protein S3 [Nanoarchaeota archaeon]